MSNFPAEIRFSSILTYDPDRRKTDQERRKARDFVDALKRDGFFSKLKSSRVIPFVAKRISELKTDFVFLAEFFGDDTLLIPMPRSTPLVENGLWVPSRICDELLNEGLGKDISPCVIRLKESPKSASSPRGCRPDASEHFATMGIDEQITWQFRNYRKILLVDDVVTRGSTFVGAFTHVSNAFPNADIKCFAIVSTRGLNNFTRLLDPVDGVIRHEFDTSHRIP